MSQLKMLTQVRHYNRFSVFFGHAKYLLGSFPKIFTQDHVKDEDKQTYVKHDTIKGWSKVYQNRYAKIYSILKSSNTGTIISMNLKLWYRFVKNKG